MGVETFEHEIHQVIPVVEWQILHQGAQVLEEGAP